MTLARWRTLARLFRGSAGLLAQSVAVAVFQSLLLVPIALVVRHVFDDVIPRGDVRALVLFGALVLALYVASALLGLWTRYAALKATKATITDVRGSLLERLYGLRQAYFDRADIGRLHSTVVQDTERLDVMSNALVAQLLPAALVGSALGVTLVVLSGRLFLVLLCLLPVLVLTGRWLGRRVRAWTRRYQRAFDTFSTDVALVLRSMYLTKAQAAEREQLEERRARFGELGEAGRRMAWLSAAYTLVNGAVAASAGVVVLVVGGAAVARGTMTLGELLSFFAVLALLRAQVTTVLTTVPQVIAGLESLSRLERILDADAPEPYAGRAAIDFRGGVRLEDVRFAYGGRPVLRRASLELEPGDRVALVGPNGAGKSTIVSLVLGLYRPDAGRLLADGRDYEELDLRSVRRRIGVVLQDPLILPATIRENIAFGVGRPTAAEVEEAAERATAAEFVERLPDGYETEVGAEGVRLSAGQRQRIAIARALVRRPALIVLDEPTTYLDAAATAALVASLRDLPWQPSLLLIGHDDALLPEVDRTYRLAGGETELVGDDAVARLPLRARRRP